MRTGLRKNFGGFMKLKTQCLIVLATLSIIDAVIPVPIVGLILFFVLLQKPAWFYNLVREVYNVSQ